MLLLLAVCFDISQGSFALRPLSRAVANNARAGRQFGNNNPLWTARRGLASSRPPTSNYGEWFTKHAKPIIEKGQKGKYDLPNDQQISASRFGALALYCTAAVMAITTARVYFAKDEEEADDITNGVLRVFGWADFSKNNKSGGGTGKDEVVKTIAVDDGEPSQNEKAEVTGGGLRVMGEILKHVQEKSKSFQS